MKIDQLLSAISKGDTNEVAELISADKNVVNAMPENGKSALHEAVWCRNHEIVKLLIDNGAELEKGTKITKATPLHFAVEDGNVELCKYLLSRGASPNTPNYFGHSPQYVSEKGETGRKPNPEIATIFNEWTLSNIPTKVKSLTDNEILSLLNKLCQAYAENDRSLISQLEPNATDVGKILNMRGGLSEMRRIFNLLNDQGGKRTLEMHWGGIGDWRG